MYDWTASPEYRAIDRAIIEGLIFYGRHGIEPGSFLRSVLENDLMMSAMRASPHNQACLKEICMFIHWEMPSQCHGSAEAVTKWLAGEWKKHRDAKERTG